MTKSRRLPPDSDPPERTAPDRRVWWSVLLLVGALAIVFRPICSHQFVSFDDLLHLHNNPHLNPPSWSGLANLWRRPYKHEYVPLSYTLYALEARLARLPSGESGEESLVAGVFHAGSLILHTAATLAVFTLLRLLFANQWGATAGALLFGLHPLQVEAVAWVSETRGLLAGLLALCALVLYVRFANTQLGPVRSPTGKAFRGRGSYAGAWACYLLGLLAKSSAVVTPLIALLLDVGALRRTWRTALWCLMPWLALAGIFAVIMMGEQGSSQLEFVAPIWARPLLAADALLFYAGKFLLPMELAVHYDRAPATVMSSPWFWTAWIPIAIAICLLWRFRHWRWLWLSVGVFAAGLAPVLGFVPFLFQNYSTVADRYVYLAMLGPALGTAALLTRCRSRYLAIGCGILLGVYALLSWFQVAHWRDSFTLYEQALRVNPRSHLAHNNLAADYIRASNYAAALPHAEAVVALQPRSLEAPMLRALALSGLGRTAEAIEAYQKIVIEFPRESVPRINLAVLLYRAGRADEAIAEYRQALSLNAADWPLIADRLARLLATHPDATVRNGEEALRYATAACRQTGYSVPELLGTLAAALAENRRFTEAEKVVGQALALALGPEKESLRSELEEQRVLYRQQQPLRDTNPTR